MCGGSVVQELSRCFQPGCAISQSCVHCTCLQDAHTIVMNVDGTERTSFFAVFDGHGGSLVSGVSASHVLNKIMATPEWKADCASVDSIGNAMVRGFLEMDEDLRKVRITPCSCVCAFACAWVCGGLQYNCACANANKPPIMNKPHW